MYETDDTLPRRRDDKIGRIGVGDATFIVNDPGRTLQASRLPGTTMKTKRPRRIAIATALHLICEAWIDESM